jgi:hypothetical protein
MHGPPGLHPNNEHRGAHWEYDSCTAEPPHCTPDDPNHVEDGVGKRPKSEPRFITKDSGQRQEYESGMRRDLQDGKPRFGLIFPEGVPYQDQLLTRFAELLARGAEKYGENNWQLANSEEELKRFRESGLRHMIQWACGETDEDHATAVIFNLMAYENTKRKLES